MHEWALVRLGDMGIDRLSGAQLPASIDLGNLAEMVLVACVGSESAFTHALS
jgi:hypothetical protein